MTPPTLTLTLDLLAVIGLGFALLGAMLAWRFARRMQRPVAAPPLLCVLRPLCGTEPMLADALRSTLSQMKPGMQAIFGVQDPADPAIGVVGQLRTEFPALDITLVVNGASHGSNRKISNLINMLAQARHEILVFCDSDLHVAPDYLARLAASLAEPGCGLATTICLGLPTRPGLVPLLGACGISHSFVPAVLVSRMLGRQDCLGTTMALHRSTLNAVGGLAALANHLADDNVLGALVQQLGLGVALAPTVPRTGVAEAHLADLWGHEMRWARTIRALEPCAYAGTIVLYPLFWALLALVAAPGGRSLAAFGAVWAARAMLAAFTERCLGGRKWPGPAALLLPVRDLLHVAEVATAFAGSRVVWRGRVMRTDPGLVAPASKMGAAG